MTSTTNKMDSLMKPHWNEQEQQQARTVLEFIQRLMNDHDFESIRSEYQSHPYKQHNRTMADGIEGVLQTVSDLVKRAPEFGYDVKQVFVDGPFVILHSHATLQAKHRGNERKGLNIIDTWRLSEGRLVEHWDAVEGLSGSMRLYGLLTGGKVRNQNGVF